MASIVVRNLDPSCSEEELKRRFSHCGEVASTKVLEPNSKFRGLYGFVNFFDEESCDRAVEKMNRTNFNGFTLHVQYADRNKGRVYSRYDSVPSTNFPGDSSNGGKAPMYRQHTRDGNTPSKHFYDENSTEVSSPMFEQLSKGEIDQQDFDKIKQITRQFIEIPLVTKLPARSTFEVNANLSVYLSHYDLPSTVYVSTLEDLVRSKFLTEKLINFENRFESDNEKLSEKFAQGQYCLAKRDKKWARAQIVELNDRSAKINFVDYGNVESFIPKAELRAFPNDFDKDPALCEKCFLDGISTDDQISDEQRESIKKILVVGLKIQMEIVRLENSVPFVRLKSKDRDLNEEIALILTRKSRRKKTQSNLIENRRLELDPEQIHSVQLTSIVKNTESFHVFVIRDSFIQIYNLLKSWDENTKSTSKNFSKEKLVCARSTVDDLWYRAWIEQIEGNFYHVLLVDFGRKEKLSVDRLCECPDSLKDIPWLFATIQLQDTSLSDEDREFLLEECFGMVFDMKIKKVYQDYFSVSLTCNKKSIIDIFNEKRAEKQKKLAVTPSKPNETKEKTPIQDTSTKEDSLPSTFVVEQRKQTAILRQILAAINTTNSLLSQLVKKDSVADDLD